MIDQYNVMPNIDNIWQLTKYITIQNIVIILIWQYFIVQLHQINQNSKQYHLIFIIFYAKINLFMSFRESLEEYKFSSRKFDQIGKMTASTGFGNSPFLRSSRKSFSFSQGNVKGKLEEFAEILSNLQDEIQLLSNQTSQTKRSEQTISKNLKYQLEQKQNKLVKNIKDIEIRMQNTYVQQNNRVKQIKDNVDDLFKQRLRIKQQFIGLRTRIESIENIMGYYGANQKYRS